MNKTFQELVSNYNNNFRDPQANLLMGQYYDSLGQTAGALSFYLRAAELTDDDNLAYDCLIRNAVLIDKLSRRPFSAKGQLYHAVTLIPTRPEAYFHISRFHEQKQEWLEMYATITQAQKFGKPYTRSTTIDLDYPGDYVLDFQKAVAAWWMNRGEESADIFKHLLSEHEMRWDFALGCINNLKRTGRNNHPPRTYTGDLSTKLHSPFKDAEKIKHNFSEAYQDMFVLTMLEGKRKGTYLEIGSADPFKNSNTALLETNFDWKGISVDFLQEKVEEFNRDRKNKTIQADAREVDYAELLKDFGRDIDYLQVDCDPSEVTYEVLEKIPFDKHRFAVITYEHDAYQDGDTYRVKSRELLSKAGYVLVAGDIAPDKSRTYEDWWAHPELISKNVLSRMVSSDNRIKRADLYMQGEYR